MNNNGSERMWHCKICGGYQPIDDCICRNCKTDLGLTGEVVVRSTADANNAPHVVLVNPPPGGPVQTGGPIQTGGPVQIGGPIQTGGPVQIGGPIQTGGTGKNKKKKKGVGKKIAIAFLIIFLLLIFAVVGAFGFLLLMPDDPDDYITTTAPVTTTEPTTTQPPASDADGEVNFPDFASFAGDFATETERKYTDGGSLFEIYYEIGSENADEIIDEFISFIDSEYEFDKDVADEDRDWYGFLYDGSVSLSTNIETSFTDGTVYEGHNATIRVQESDGKKTLKVTLIKDIRLVEASKKTKFLQPSYPDFASVAGDYAQEIDSEYSDNGIYEVTYSVDPDEVEAIVDHYSYLLIDHYNYTINNGSKEYNWRAFTYTGDYDGDTMVTTLPDDTEYDGHVITTEIVKKGSEAYVCIAFIADLNLVEVPSEYRYK